MTTATMPSTNGTAHRHNGHAPASRLGNELAPLDAVSTVAEPKPVGDRKPPAEGRNATGTFAPGNKFAKGNPNARKMAALRSALLEGMTADRMKALGERLYAAAMAGNLIAAKMLLVYAIGKPPESVDADRLDLDEWKLLDAAPTLAQLMRAWLDGIAPTSAAEVLKKWYESNETGDFNKLKEGRLYSVEHIDCERKARIGK